MEGLLDSEGFVHAQISVNHFDNVQGSLSTHSQPKNEIRLQMGSKEAILHTYFKNQPKTSGGNAEETKTTSI